MNRVSLLLIIGALTTACGSTSIATPTNTPQPTLPATTIPPSPTPNPGSIIFPDVSDKKISENPESVVLLKEISINEIIAPNEPKQVSFDFKNKKAIVIKSEVTEIWDFGNEELQLLQSFDGQYYGIKFSPTGNKFVSGGHKIWDINSGQSIELNAASDMDFSARSFSPDGSQLATASYPYYDNMIMIWDTNTGELIKTLSPRSNDGVDPDASSILAFSSDGKKIVSGYSHFSSSGFEVWDVETGRKLFTLDEDGYTPYFSFSLDGQSLASTSDIYSGRSSNRYITLWDVNTGNLVENNLLVQGSSTTNGILFSPDGKQLAIAEDSTVILLEVNTLNIQQTLEDTGAWVEYLLDGRLLVSVGSGKIQFWGVP